MSNTEQSPKGNVRQMKVSPMLTKILNESFNEAKNAHHEFFTPEHVLKVALQNDFVNHLLLECGSDNDALRSNLSDFLSCNNARFL